MSEMTGTTDLESFLAAPAYGATELHVVDGFRRATAGDAANWLGNELIDQILGGSDGPSEERPRVISIAWMGPIGTSAEILLRPTDLSPDTQRTILTAARRLRVPVRYWIEDNQIVGSAKRQVGALFCPRVPAKPGPLATDARLLDTPTRFDVTISRTDKPGVVGRKVMRRSPVEETFQAIMDEHWIVIDHRHRKGHDRLEILQRDLLGIVDHLRRPLAITAESHHPLPTLSHWSALDFRGREFATWVYDRMLARMGI